MRPRCLHDDVVVIIANGVRMAQTFPLKGVLHRSSHGSIVKTESAGLIRVKANEDFRLGRDAENFHIGGPRCLAHLLCQGLRVAAQFLNIAAPQPDLHRT